MMFSSDDQARPHSAMSENEFINRMREHMAEEVGGYVCSQWLKYLRNSISMYKGGLTTKFW